MHIWMFWVAVALMALATEMFTGTFSLLVVAIGCGGAAVASVFGAPLWLQITVASVVSFVGWFLLWKYRSHRPVEAQPSLDVGEPVEVLGWTDQTHCRVRYRGALWNAALISGKPTDSRFVVSRINGVDLEIAAKPS